MFNRRKIAIALLVLLGNTLAIHRANAGVVSDLTIEINGLSNRKGQVCVNVFGSSRGFPGNSTNAVRKECVHIATAPLVIKFANLPAGNYAVAVIHDENSDGTLNRNFLGIPIEGFGFSRNPTIRTGPPQYNDSAVFVAGTNTEVQIQLNYLLGR